ncbi:FIST C-terminal domain-containing protein [Evansella cellulosilytica]|uniref:FIST C domain n=1 Tax=Evansella cellulosilytica (strain ATCC 21833 / DSM 2522 / FERM P-1141 / JCM 9156 / N-4) TaxID=649639 RepID=E6U112_EVAC2|nr:FIST C-terminal domain-containing protein [Evansella cellulosilytica]ADU30324.1 FIST C domain [Evansella cellulosilytica DSM 2522]
MSSFTYVGVSTADSWEVAGREATIEAMSYITNANKPKMLKIMYTEDAEPDDYKAIYKGLRSVSNDVIVIGGRVKYLYTSKGVLHKGVVVVALNWDGELIEPILFHRDYDLNKIDEQFNQSIKSYQHDYEVTIYTLWSGFNYMMNVGEQWYNTFGPSINIFGGGCVEIAIEDQVYFDYGVAVAFLSKKRFEYVLGHGCQPEGRPLMITRADKHNIYEIDGMSATEVYDQLCDDVTAKLGKKRDEGVEWSFSFGYPTVNGEYVLQEPVAINRENDSIQMFLEIPDNSVVRILVARSDTIFNKSVQLVDEYMNKFDNTPNFNLVINCVSRMDALDYQFREKELALFKEHLGDNHFVGFSSIGELGIPKGMPIYSHQKTLIIFGVS